MMRRLRVLWIRLSGMARAKHREAEIAAELESHLDMHIQDNLHAGMTAEEARRQAMLRLGGMEQARQTYREAGTLPWLETLLYDVRHALRQLRTAPGFTAVALLTLALGIGANAGMFTLLDAVLLKSLPVPHPEQLFVVKQSDKPAENSRYSWPLFNRMRRQLPASTPIAAMSWPADVYTRAGGAQPQRATAQLVSGNYFQVFETWPALGRLLTPHDDAKLGGSAAAVISYGYWERRFGRSPAVIGQTLEVNAVPFVIVGVAAPDFFGARPGVHPDLWVPVMMQAAVRYHNHYSGIAADPLSPWIPQDRISWLQLLVRVNDPAALPQLTTVLNRQYGDDLRSVLQGLPQPELLSELHGIRLTLEPGQRGFANLRRDFEQPILLLMGMAAMVLLIACANIANLLLARATAKQRAVAVQLSLGASRTRILRQMLTESLLLSGLGGVLGIAVAYWCARVLPRWASAGSVPIPLNLAPDARILVFCIVATMSTGLLFGLAPALDSARVDPASVLKSGSQSISGRAGFSRWPLRKLLVSAQVALSLVLLVGAGMFLQTLANYARLDPGFDRDHLLGLHLDTNLVGYTTSEFLALYPRLTAQIEAIPGVRSASVTTCSLDAGCEDASDLVIAGLRHGSSRRATVPFNRVADNYFATVGIPLLRGRNFRSTDTLNAPKVAIVNQTFARLYLPQSNPIGRELFYPDQPGDSFQVVGVVADARINNVRAPAPPVFYLPITQAPGNIDGLEIRIQADPQWVSAKVRQAVAAVDPRIPISDISTLKQEASDDLVQERLVARLTSLFCALALGLACLGLYGVMSYIVQRRTGEIGVRIALGSSRRAVLWLILKETALLITAGSLVGILLSVAAMHLAKSFLFGLSPEDPGTIALAAGLLYLVSMASGFLPARLAASMDAVQALRSE